ncbi:MAG: 16S rRNA (guanine(966)-N(2))-methyltransferase RsmD, partial [Caldilineaceae bacterium]
MRVITGKAKGRRLQSVPGDTTRPITDRAKEALFSILSDWIVGTRVLDLFGGTGGVGIECLSRGADFAQFVDNSRAAVDTINANLKHCRLEKQASVERGDSFAFLRMYKSEPFDLIFVAPPQYEGMWKRALLQIDTKPRVLAEYGSVVVQVHPREEEPLELKYLQEYDRRRYGSVMLIFYAPAAALAAEAEAAETEAEDLEDDELDEPLDDSYDEAEDADDDDEIDDEDDEADEEEDDEQDPDKGGAGGDAASKAGGDRAEPGAS